MQPIEYRCLGDPTIIRISVTLGLLFYVGTERFGIPGLRPQHAVK
jgi:hypothetical protein